MVIEILPDTRGKTGAVPFEGMYWIPVHCGNCHKAGPLVPEENMTFAFWLCDNCAHWGVIAGMMLIPDEVFWRRIEQEQIEKYGHVLSMEELESVVASDLSPLATLIKEGPNRREEDVRL